VSLIELAMELDGRLLPPHGFFFGHLHRVIGGGGLGM
jgi:hypothetical protein